MKFCHCEGLAQLNLGGDLFPQRLKNGTCNKMPPKRKEAPKLGQAPVPEEEDEKLRGSDKAADAGADSDAEGEDDGSEGEVHDLGEGDYLDDRLQGDDDDEDEEGEDEEEEEDDDAEDDAEEEEEDAEKEEDEEEEEGEEGEDDEEEGEEQRGNLWDSDGDDEAGEEEGGEEEEAVETVATSKSKRMVKPSVRDKPVLPRGIKEQIKNDAAKHQHEQEGRIVPESDSEEDGPIMRNPVGNVPMEWYKDEKHIGYSLDGKQILRRHNKDSLDRHLDKADDPESWRSVYDEVNDEELRLTDAEVKLLRHLRGGRYEPEINPYEDYPMPFDDPLLKIHPAHDRLPPISNLVPKKYEAENGREVRAHDPRRQAVAPSRAPARERALQLRCVGARRRRQAPWCRAHPSPETQIAGACRELQPPRRVSAVEGGGRGHAQTGPGRQALELSATQVRGAAQGAALR